MPPKRFRALLVALLFLAVEPIVMPMNLAFCREKYIEEYEIPTSGSGPIGITVGAEGVVWFAETNVSKIARFNPKDQTFKEYSLPASDRLRREGAQIWGMKFDSGGRLWFTEATEAAIWMFDTVKETFERYPLQSGQVFPIQLIFDSEGILWFTELYGDRVGRLDPSKTVNGTREGVTEYLIPTSEAGAGGLVFDRAGYLWFTESFAKKVSRLDVRSIRFKEYEAAKPVYALVGVAFDKAGRLWLTDHGSSRFYRFNPQTGEWKDYSTSESPFFPVSLPYYIIADSRGRIWMNEHYGNIIAEMNPETEVLTEYHIPTGDPLFGGISNTLYLTVDGDDNIWFTEWTANKIAVLNTRLPVPFTLEISDRKVRLNRGENVNITVKLTADGLLDNPIHLYASGTFTPSGRLEGLEASFTPAEITADRSVSTLNLKTSSNLKPGVYTLMVGGRYSDVNRLVAVEVVVGSSSVSATFFETWGLMLLASTPLLFILALIIFRMLRAGRRVDQLLL